MKNTVVLNVTAKDIEKGVRDSCNKCPIARAARRKFHTDSVYVGSDPCLVDGVTWYLDRHGVDFIRHFDAHGAVLPQKIKLSRNRNMSEGSNG